MSHDQAKEDPPTVVQWLSGFPRQKSDDASCTQAGGEVALDPTGKAAGRGGYVCKSADCIQRAKTGKGLDRALKTAVPSSIYELLLTQIEPS